jgi:hypothetical protein
MDIFFSTWMTDGAPGDPDAQHVGPLVLGSDGCVMASFNGLPNPASLFTSFMGEVGQFGESNPKGVVTVFGGSP